MNYDNDPEYLDYCWNKRNDDNRLSGHECSECKTPTTEAERNRGGTCFYCHDKEIYGDD